MSLGLVQYSIIKESKGIEGLKPFNNTKAILKGTPTSFEASDNIHKKEKLALMQFQAKFFGPNGQNSIHRQ